MYPELARLVEKGETKSGCWPCGHGACLALFLAVPGLPVVTFHYVQSDVWVLTGRGSRCRHLLGWCCCVVVRSCTPSRRYQHLRGTCRSDTHTPLLSHLASPSLCRWCGSAMLWLLVNLDLREFASSDIYLEAISRWIGECMMIISLVKRPQRRWVILSTISLYISAGARTLGH